MSQKFKLHSLVLYKNGPALIDQLGDKISIQLLSGEAVKVRDKDIQLLHLGPLARLSDVNQVPAGDLVAAWELLQGETVTLTELAEFIYGENTPCAVWQAWLVFHEQIYFSGSLDQIGAKTRAEVDAIIQKRREKEQQATGWQEYLQRVREKTILPEDIDPLKDVERLAYGKASMNRTLKELGIEVTPQNAHKLLLQLGLWNETVNPYPARFDCAIAQPEFEVPELADESREDLTALETFAIDDENCSDPDDAISLDGDSLWIHVADAAALIHADSPLDLEARARGANLYLPERVIHMLPPAVTSALGLGLKEISPALSFKIRLHADGATTCSQIALSWINVQRLSYSTAEQRMDTSPFREIRAITDQFRMRRLARGAADINLPEVKIRAGVRGELYNLSDRHELSLKKPDEYTIEISELPRLKSRDMPFASQSPPDETSVPETMAQMFAYRKKFKRSELHLDPRLHAGLGLEQYTRATSPLRRYSDLLVHQQVRAFIRGEPLIGESAMMERLTEAETGGGNTSMAERQSNRHWTLVYMQQHPDSVYQGVVVDKRDDRGTVLIPELGIDVKMRRMADCHLDDEVELKLLEINLPELDLFCRMV